MESPLQPLLDAPCCLLHTFFRIATLHPHKIAIVHASSRIPSSTSPQDSHIQTPVGTDRGRAEKIGHSLHHDAEPILPVYPGDVVYTYQELQGAVESLADHLAHEFSEWHASTVGHSEGGSFYFAPVHLYISRDWAGVYVVGDLTEFSIYNFDPRNKQFRDVCSTYVGWKRI